MSADLQEQLTRGFEKALGSQSPAVATYVAEGRGALPGAARLLAWDANSIHGFVFDTANATAIRGASEVLRKLDEDLVGGEPLGLDAAQILFAGGGSGLAVVSEAQARKATARLHELFAERTLVGTCCAATVELGSGDAPFNELYDAWQNELARERVHSGSDAEPASSFFALRCEVCGRRAATKAEARKSGLRPECAVCQFMIELGKKSRYDSEEVTDFEAIADEERGGFLAVVYLDGNGIGRRISELPSPLAYATFSGAMKRLLRGAFENLAAEYGLVEEGGKDGSRRRGHSYQLPICGGDDLVAILPGNVAVPFTRDLLRHIEQKADQDPELQHSSFRKLEKTGAGAGVAIGKKGFPIRHLITEAEELRETAKKRCYRDAGVRSALDFAEVTDGSPRGDSGKARWRGGMFSSGRPYSLPELDDFSARFNAVRRASIGRSQLYAFQRYAGAGLAQLRNHALYQMARSHDWRDLIGKLAGDPDAVRDKERAMRHVVPEYGGRRIFDVADMIELFDHWREPEEAAA